MQRKRGPPLQWTCRVKYPSPPIPPKIVENRFIISSSYYTLYYSFHYIIRCLKYFKQKRPFRFSSRENLYFGLSTEPVAYFPLPVFTILPRAILVIRQSRFYELLLLMKRGCQVTVCIAFAISSMPTAATRTNGVNPKEIWKKCFKQK